jgi:hypothetical protein
LKKVEEEKERLSRREMKRSTFMEPIPKSKANLMRLISITHEIERVFFKSLYFYLFPYLVLPMSYYVFPPSSVTDSA